MVSKTAGSGDKKAATPRRRSFFVRESACLLLPAAKYASRQAAYTEKSEQRKRRCGLWKLAAVVALVLAVSALVRALRRALRALVGRRRRRRRARRYATLSSVRIRGIRGSAWRRSRRPAGCGRGLLTRRILIGSRSRAGRSGRGAGLSSRARRILLDSGILVGRGCGRARRSCR